MKTRDLFLKLVSLLPFLFMEVIASFIELEIRGKERIPRGGYVLCPTHKGELDPYFIRKALGDRLLFEKENQFIYRLKASSLVRNLFLAHWGGWIVITDGINVGALRAAMTHLRQGKPVTIFPMGHERSFERLEVEVKPLYPGAAFLACKTGKPMLPLRIDGGVFIGEGRPFYLFPFLTLKRYLKECRKVTLTFLEPIYPDLERYEKENRAYIGELTQRLKKRLLQLKGEPVG